MSATKSTATSELLADLFFEISERRKELGLTLAAIGERIGKSPIWVGALFSGQATLTKETLPLLAEALAVDESSLEPLLVPVVRNADPLVYRLHEMVDVFGEAIRTWTAEEFGDGILSAIDITIDCRREGGRAVITLDSKFLPYKEF